MLMAALPAAHAQQSAPSQAVAAPPAYEPRSGDAAIDRYLIDINRYADRYPHAFADEMARYHAVPRPYVEAMLQQPNWSAGDIYFACALAQTVGQPCRAIVREWSRDHEAGWQGVASRLGVEPHTERYQRLREALKRTYQRWDRPSPE